MSEKQGKPADQNLAEQACASYEHGRQQAQEFEQRIEKYITDKPIQSLAIAAGVGILLGIVWGRR